MDAADTREASQRAAAIVCHRRNVVIAVLLWPIDSLLVFADGAGSDPFSATSSPSAASLVSCRLER